MATATYSFRLNETAKKDAQKMYEHYGISLAAAINTFLVKSVEVGGFPFAVSQSSAEPFSSAEEADEFISRSIRRMLSETR